MVAKNFRHRQLFDVFVNRMKIDFNANMCYS